MITSGMNNLSIQIILLDPVEKFISHTSRTAGRSVDILILRLTVSYELTPVGFQDEVM